MEHRRITNHRNAVLAVAWAVALLGAAAPAWSGFSGGFHSFCVGSCAPPPYIHTAPLETPVGPPLDLAFSIRFDDVVLDDGAGFTFLELRSQHDQELFRITIEQVSEAGTSVRRLGLDYRVAGGLEGTLDLGEAAEGFECFWVRWTPMSLSEPLGSGIRVVRSLTSQDFDTGGVAIVGEPALVRQGILGYHGATSGSVLMSEAEIGVPCGVGGVNP